MTLKLMRLDVCLPPIFGTKGSTAAAAFAVVFLLGTVPTPRAQAQTLVVLHDFSGGADGGDPSAPVVMDRNGNLYGTTEIGGSSGYGTVFKLDTTGKETLLHSFTNTPDGSDPAAGLIMDKAGNLYSTTAYGGIYGYGTVFKFDSAGNEVVLHSFSGTPDGAFPRAGLLTDKRGNLYGTTLEGGSSDNGTVFKVDTSGNEAVLHSFTILDGSSPAAGVIMDKAGNLYGTAHNGGSSGSGTVFKLDTTGKETLLHSFTYFDGAGPWDLVMDKAGNLYGTTTTSAFGYGTVFKLDTNGNETMLHSFTYSDGAYPSAGLIMDKEGNLYGTTAGGGSSVYGTVFKLDTTGKEIVLYNFSGPDGEGPSARLFRDRRGNLYGTTLLGGPYGYGTAFKLIP
jgi:uncharacterized repeat protein (TIGR03803 family)